MTERSLPAALRLLAAVAPEHAAVLGRLTERAATATGGERDRIVTLAVGFADLAAYDAAAVGDLRRLRALAAAAETVRWCVTGAD